jgi:hypothetical protein
MSKSMCSIDGCGSSHEARGLCFMHYARWRRHGDVERRDRLPNGQGVGRYVKPNGYVVVRERGHPLAAPSSGLVYEHRLVLYASIGAGEHPCHWCGARVSWQSVTHPLAVDHIDQARANNVASNLVPSCTTCNSTRTQNPIARAEGTRRYVEARRRSEARGAIHG